MHLTIIRHSIRNRGADKLLLDYSKYLVNQGHTITYWTNEIKTAFDIDSRIQRKKIPLSTPLGTIVFTLFFQCKTDVLLVDLIVMAFFAGLRNKKKLVYFAQDHDVEYYASPILRSLTQKLYQHAACSMDLLVICVSNRLAKTLRPYGFKKIKVVTNGIDLEKFYIDDQSAYFKEKQKDVVIVIYARKDYRKGLNTAIKAIEELQRMNCKRTWKVWLIGERISSSSFSDHFSKKLGFLTEGQLRSVLSAGDVFVCASRHEGFGLLPLQAMACGCAIAATDTLDFVVHGETALVSRVDDEKELAQNIACLIDDSQLMEKLKRKAFQESQKYDIGASCSIFESALKEASEAL